MKINLVMIVKNEERCLRRCLKAARPLVDQMIIVDTGSSDRTKRIAGEFGAMILDFPWVGDFSAARNVSLGHSDADWNLVLDADEYLRPCSRKKLESMLESRGGMWIGGITRYDSYQDQAGVSQSASVLPRLLPRGVRYTGIIHEQPEGKYPCYALPLAADHDGYMTQDKGQRNLPYLEKAVRENPDDGYYQFQMAVTLRNIKRLEESLDYFRRFYVSSQPGEDYRAGGVVLYLYTLLDLGSDRHLNEAAEVVEREEPVLGGWSDFCFVCGLFYMKRVLSDVGRYIELLPNIEKSYLRCMSLGERPEFGGVVGTGSFKAAYNLGAWYEVSGQIERAADCYRKAAKEGYGPAKERLREIKRAAGR